MTASFFASAFTGLLHVAVPSYGLRLTRRFGSQQVGWVLVFAFLGLALLNLFCGTNSSNVLPESATARILVYMVIPILLLVGLAHVETLFRERARWEREGKVFYDQLEQIAERRTEELVEFKSEFDRERIRRDLELRAFAEIADKERLQLLSQAAGRAGQYLNRASTVMELYLKLLTGTRSPFGLLKYSRRLQAQTAELREVAHRLLACGGCEPVRPQLLSLSVWLHRQLPALRECLEPTQQLECTCPAGPLPVWADPFLVRWIVEELIRNASAAIGSNGRVTITVEMVTTNRPAPGDAGNAHQFYSVTVADSGGGINRETHRHLGKPFLTDARDHRFGLGLAAATGLMKQHGGSLSISSTPELGTRVRLFFPRVSCG